VTLYYVAHRLFAAHDRALGALIAHRVARDHGADAVFLPFCDTDEDNLVDTCKGRRLFEADVERLNHIDAMIAVLHGPSLDDGVCMEIGYAAARGTPVIAVTTDFQTYGPARDATSDALFPDPLLPLILTNTITVQRLPPPHPGGHADRFGVFLEQNLRAVMRAADEATSRLAEPIRVGHPDLPPPPRDGQRSAYLEAGPYGTFGWTRKVEAVLRAVGWNTYRAKRMHAGRSGHDQAARADWEALSAASMAVVDVAGPETPPGAAAVIGACSATGRPVYAPDPGCWWTFAHGREPNFRNLMIQYGLTGTFTNPDELTTLAEQPQRIR
jgi:nucleoside 2-deoxyribosyltransferase